MPVLMLNYHVVLLLHQDHPGVGPGHSVGQAHLQPVDVGDGPGPQTEPLVGRDLGGVVPEDSLHQDTARARPVTSRLTEGSVPGDTLTVERETFRVVIDCVISNYWSSMTLSRHSDS